jgi:hypothetical protein
MRNLLHVLGLLAAIIVVAGCNNVKSGSGLNATGKSSEILVVCEKSQWDGAIGQAIKKVFGAELEGLPESESRFSMVNIPLNSFTRFLQPHRNVFIIDINAANGKTKANARQNVWSHPQRVVEIKAQSDSAFVSYFTKYGEAISALFEQNERACYQAVNSLNRNIKAETAIETATGLRIVIPADFYLAKNKDGFLWLRKETTEMSLGIMIYTYPYTDTNQVSNANICALRNKNTSAYIPGPSEGSYMLISSDVIKPVSKRMQFKNKYAVETRGLWFTKGDFMGGPFINYSIVDESKQRVVVLDGFVYRPNKEKRNYIRQLESIFWNAEFAKNQTITNKKN